MTTSNEKFDEQHCLAHLRHYLPAQAALKDFVHHNTLHAFQDTPFHEALWRSSHIFGYTTYLSLDEFRALYAAGKIRTDVLDRAIREHIATQAPQKGTDLFLFWKQKMLEEHYTAPIMPRIGALREGWKRYYQLSLDKVVQAALFRIIASFLDQGIAVWEFPNHEVGLLEALRKLEQNGWVSIFKTRRAKRFLLENKKTLTDLLQLLVGDEDLFERYLFDQQFAHAGWSGFVATVEQQPSTLLSHRNISFSDFIYLELLLEIDALDAKFGEIWSPLALKLERKPTPLFAAVEGDETLKTVLRLWQDAYEWTYFDGVLRGVQLAETPKTATTPSFQGLFCIDDREYSFRRHLEAVDSRAETFGTPGFFGVEFYFRPENGKFHTKACPASVEPKFLVKETGRKDVRKHDLHFTKRSHGLVQGWLISNTLGFWSALKLFLNVFRPTVSPAMSYSFQHMDRHSTLQIDATGEVEEELKVGYTVDEMTLRVKNVLQSIGLTKDFAPIVYVVGHGGSSVNNPYYAGYNCGACCGRPGGVNARVFAYMANKKEVRTALETVGIHIPEKTFFVPAMRDTTRDEVEFYDEKMLPEHLKAQHEANRANFEIALSRNAAERALRFSSVNSGQSLAKQHEAVKRRSVALFEPRPEWNHTDNALCIVGRKPMYDHIYLDKRPFINSYDYAQDPTGEYLAGILGAAVPVCGGINLEYYFSRVDTHQLGSGTKLPHNIVGLFAVNTGIDGDLRSGLPSQMIEIHDPVRILFIVEQLPEIVLRVLQSNPNIYEWVKNEWVVFSVKNPETGEVLCFRNGSFEPYQPLFKAIRKAKTERDLDLVIAKTEPFVLFE